MLDALHVIWFSTQTGQPSHHIFFETPAAPFFSPSKIKPHIESVYGFATAGTVTEKDLIKISVQILTHCQTT